MPWRNWADWAYRNQAVLLNWARGAPIPSVNFRDLKASFTAQMMKDMVRPRDRQAGVKPALENERDDAGVRIERWTSGMSNFSSLN